MKILFFIGGLERGGRERRLIELLSFLKKNTEIEMKVVIRRNAIDYPAFLDLQIPHCVLSGEYKKGDLKLPYNFYKICRGFRPDIIHTWGSMPASVALFAKIVLKIPLVNSQISDAPAEVKKWSLENFLTRINFIFSEVILANSRAGLKSYGVESMEKCKVIYNGVNFHRFENLPERSEIKEKYHLVSPFTVVMSASFTSFKNYDYFTRVAKYITAKRSDTTFIGVGGHGNEDTTIYDRVIAETRENPRILFPGIISDVEALVNACDIGVLFSRGEGMSNSIIEYMALGKPVISNDIGGTRELVQSGVNGYLITSETFEETGELINRLLDNPDLRVKMGEAGRKRITESFSVERMGKEFVSVYQNLLQTKKN